MSGRLRHISANTRFAIGWVVGCAVIFGLQPAVQAASQSEARVTILPVVCVVDVVQDGNSQSLQTTAGGCDVVLPNLVTPIADAAQTPRFSLPFAGQDSSEQLVAQPKGVRTSWFPIASTQQAGKATQHMLRSASVLAAGIAAVGIVTLVGVDAALFELRYSRATVRWVRQRTLHIK